MSFRDGDYIMIPRGTMWRIEPKGECSLLMIEAVDGAYKLPDRGMLGDHAQFDPAMLDTPKIDDRFRAQQGEREWKVAVKRRNQISTITYPFNPLDAEGWKGTLMPVKLRNQFFPKIGRSPLMRFWLYGSSVAPSLPMARP